jgi:speckle-type POZ protein
MANKSSSTYRCVASVGVHRLTINGHSVAALSGEPITSKPFWVGGYEWSIRYHPNGHGSGEHSTVYLVLENAGEAEVITVFFIFSSLQDPASSTADEKNKARFVAKFSLMKNVWGRDKFMRKADLTASGFLKDDCLVIKCRVGLITKELTYDQHDDQGCTGVVVPPSDLTQQLGHLLESGTAADMTVEVGGGGLEKFKAHRCVLAARSPVFGAMLCGSMKESKENKIRIEDMESGVFEVLLHYMYHDDLPAFMTNDVCTEEATNMAQGVLVAADRYGMERLKLMCESMLSKTMDVYTVCSTLGFADRHSCERLRNSCLKYMLKDRERLKVIVNTEGSSSYAKSVPMLRPKSL